MIILLVIFFKCFVIVDETFWNCRQVTSLLPQRNLLSLKSLGISLWLQIALKKYILGACYLEIDREKRKNALVPGVIGVILPRCFQNLKENCFLTTFLLNRCPPTHKIYVPILPKIKQFTEYWENHAGMNEGNEADPSPRSC